MESKDQAGQCGRGHPLRAGALACARCLTDAIRERIAPSGHYYAVRAIEDGHVGVQVVVADSVGMPQSGHLVFGAKDGRVLRIYTPSTWLSVRDVTAEGPEAVAEFLAGREDGAGTA